LDGYPYELPFELQLKKPMLVVQDWAALRLVKSDNWHSELIEATDFDPAGAKNLQTIEQLKIAQTQPGNWLIATLSSSHKDILEGWVKVAQGSAWNLYHSTPTDSESVNNELSSEALKKCMR
jgi:hypothetical protein